LPIFRFRDLLELAVGYGLILAVIWTANPAQRVLFWIALVWILITTVIRLPDIGTLGLNRSGLRCSVWMLGAVAAFAGVLLAIASERHTLHPLHGHGPIAAHATGYVLWAFQQQFILQDYFLLRLLRILPRKRQALIVAAVLFSTAHLPNPILMPLTLVWGLVSCTVFLRRRNLYALGLAHGILGLSIAISLPDTITHHMMVGLGYLRYHL